MPNLRPSYAIPSVSELYARDIRWAVPDLAGMTFDLDKTLIGQHGLDIPEAHLATLHRLGSTGLELGIISNAQTSERTARVIEIANEIAGFIGNDVHVVTSQMIGGTRKPKRPVFDEMSRRMAITPSRLCHVGDQLLKDVLGANNAGYGGSVLVAPYGEGDDWRVRFLQRPLEAAVRPLIGLPLQTRNFKR